MIKKQSSARETAPPVKAKKAAPRVKAAKHRTVQAKSQEAPEKEGPETGEETIAVEVTVAAPLPLVLSPREAIAKLAYSYWESRGFQHGDPTSDWLRAEAEDQANAR